MLITAVAGSAPLLKGQASPAREALRSHVYTLASDEMLGRKAGSAEAADAAAYIMSNFRDIGLYPAAIGDDGERAYIQNFGKSPGKYANVVAFLPGNDPQLREEYIVLGAHYDHLGYKATRGDTTVYHGADDNASGVSVLIEAARRIKAREGELRRSVIFAAFDAEEEGLYGSAALAENMAVDKVKFMASIDMVGWLRETGELSIKGTGDLSGGMDMVESIPHSEGLKVKAVGNGQGLLTGSDHDTFHRCGVPSVLITTGTLSPYHTPEDSAEKIDYEGMEIITEYVANLALDLAARDEIKPASRGRKAGGVRPVEFAVAASIGSSGLNFYPRGAMQGLPLFSWNAGAFIQYNFNEEMALRAEVNYAHRTFRYPIANQAGELLATGGYRKLVSPVLTVPATLLVKFHFTSDSYLYAGAGLYYAYVFDARIDGEPTAYYRNMGGFSLAIGWNLKHFGVGYTGYMPFMYSSPSTPRTWGYSNYWTVYYKF